jgi:hypothetical protein
LAPAGKDLQKGMDLWLIHTQLDLIDTRLDPIKIRYISAELFERLTANAKVATVLGSTRHSEILGAAGDAVLNKGHTKNSKNPQLFFLAVLTDRIEEGGGGADFNNSKKLGLLSVFLQGPCFSSYIRLLPLPLLPSFFPSPLFLFCGFHYNFFSFFILF